MYRRDWSFIPVCFACRFVAGFSICISDADIGCVHHRWTLSSCTTYLCALSIFKSGWWVAPAKLGRKGLHARMLGGLWMAPQRMATMGLMLVWMNGGKRKRTYLMDTVRHQACSRWMSRRNKIRPLGGRSSSLWRRWESCWWRTMTLLVRWSVPCSVNAAMKVCTASWKSNFIWFNWSHTRFHYLYYIVIKLIFPAWIYVVLKLLVLQSVLEKCVGCRLTFFVIKILCFSCNCV